jgi:phage terminase large subunit-like protein
MMTPEQMQNTMNFIVENHANAMIRMDRFDEELREQKERIDRIVAAVDHHSELFRMIAEIMTSQQQRLKWLEDRGQ